MAGLRASRSKGPEGPRLGEQVVDVVGEERPDRPVYMAGDPRTPFTHSPPSKGNAKCRGDQRGIVYTRQCERARTEDGGSKRVKRKDLKRNGR